MLQQENDSAALKTDWLTKFYDPFLKLVMPKQKFKTTLIHSMRIEAGHRILDFRCGTLSLSILATEHYPEAEYFGVDVDRTRLHEACKKLKKINQCIFIQHYQGERLPFPDNFFDKVMSCLVFHHLTLRQKYFALDEIYRVLKPKGEVHIADFGRPASIIQRVGFYSIQLFNGFETTRDSVNDALPKAMKESHFWNAKETRAFNTLVGTVRLMKGTKSNDLIIS